MARVRSLALAALLATGGRAQTTCSFTTDYDCNGDDVAMLHKFGVNQTKCCEACAADARCATAVLATDQGGVCLLKSACSDPLPGAKNRVLCNTGGVPPPPPAPAPGAVPKWAPTYLMAESTVIMPCNYSGLYDFDAYPALGRFGLVDYDWSNAKTYVAFFHLATTGKCFLVFYLLAHSSSTPFPLAPLLVATHYQVLGEPEPDGMPGLDAAAGGAEQGAHAAREGFPLP